RPGGLGGEAYTLPAIYRLRVDPNRASITEGLGATPLTETAVKNSLHWIGDSQEPDGRWSPAKSGAGRENREDGHDRKGAGSQADAGLTGLAILTMAASGNTHQSGPYQEKVRRAMRFLLNGQAADGNLAGRAGLYEFMYSHGIATFALGELLAMTNDPNLREPVTRAVGYTIASQDPTTGGWRYTPGQAGDTSQHGWQLLALKTANGAGIPIPERTWQGARRFLDTVSSGTHRGLASYRAGQPPTRAMTAEALACRQFLGLTPESPTSREAGDYLLGEIPSGEMANLYYWYYGTMAMYQLQGTYWQQWNENLRKTLLARQVKSGPTAGSWDPNTRWDNYGGRIYSTALATLCLEAYYRFVPLHGSTPSK
ncbi:MAG: prenyltransferase/squalene oxidase repeat-containing protein, partial [Tepidisphaeraceae bacterium]